MPAPPTELKQTEKLGRIAKGDLSDYAARHAEAATAVERLNTRINGWRKLWACVKVALEKGASPDACQ